MEGRYERPVAGPAYALVLDGEALVVRETREEGEVQEVHGEYEVDGVLVLGIGVQLMLTPLVGGILPDLHALPDSMGSGLGPGHIDGDVDGVVANIFCTL